MPPTTFSVPITRAVWQDAARDPRLQKFFDAELNRERARWQTWRAASLKGPVAPWVGQDCEQILQNAKTIMATANEFADTPHGRTLAAMRDLGERAMKLTAIISQVRVAIDRSFDGELRRIDKLLKDAEEVLREAKGDVGAAQMAVDDGYAAGEAAVATPLMKVVGA